MMAEPAIDRDVIRRQAMLAAEEVLMEKIPGLVSDREAYDTGTNTIVYRSKYTNSELFSAQASWDTYRIVNHGKVATYVKITNNEKARAHVNKHIDKVLQLSECVLHLAIDTAKSQYEEALRTVAKNRGLDVTPELMMFQLVQESSKK